MSEKSIQKLIMFLNCLAAPHHLPGATLGRKFRCSRQNHSLVIVTQVQINIAKLPLFHIEIIKVSKFNMKLLNFKNFNAQHQMIGSRKRILENRKENILKRHCSSDLNSGRT